MIINQLNCLSSTFTFLNSCTADVQVGDMVSVGSDGKFKKAESNEDVVGLMIGIDIAKGEYVRATATIALLGGSFVVDSVVWRKTLQGVLTIYDKDTERPSSRSDQSGAERNGRR